MSLNVHKAGWWLPAVASLLCWTGVVRAVPDVKEDKKSPQVEVVFCLDTTGSMGGLIDGAKQKIWAISNQIASGKPTPLLKIGLVAYRDRGDEYVTKVFDLTDDLDAMHGHLKSFKAQGGGDEPESVNQALADAVHKIKWSRDGPTLRIIFLVGDAPPHMDYADDVKYPETCKKAAERGIIINTIQCGNSARTTPIWKDICVKAEGTFVQIAQNGGVVASIDTPFDKELAAINTELAKKTLCYGDREAKGEARLKVQQAQALPPAAQADRAGFSAKNRRNASYDLLDAIKSGKVQLDKLQKEELPEELQKLNAQEQKEYLEKLDKERSALQKKAVELDRKRADFIAQKQAELDKNSGFDGQVVEMLRKQAKKAKIDY